MTRTLDGQVALITGAGRGFGRAIAERFAREGAAVAVVARNKAQLEEVADAITAAGGRAAAIAGDITQPAEVKRLAAEAAEALGPVSLLVSNAGVPGPFGPIWEVSPERWWNAQQVHIRGPQLLVNALVPGMIERKAGRVIFVSAVASRMVAAYMSAYTTGKIAQNRMIAQLAVEAREHGVSAFAIDPGFVYTQLADETRSDPDAQRWLPGMMGRLDAKKDEDGGDLERCAQRCVDLASGRYDGLSGGYFELPDDLDAKLRELAATAAE